MREYYSLNKVTIMIQYRIPEDDDDWDDDDDEDDDDWDEDFMI
jgi:hypothetical protein